MNKQYVPGRCTAALIAMAAVFANAPAHATSIFIDPTDGYFDASTYLLEYPYGVLPVPIIITEPALGGSGGGLMGMFFHESEEERAKRQTRAQNSKDASRFLFPPAVTIVGAAATSNGSKGALVGHMAFWKEGRLRYRGGVGHAKFYMDYYGTPDYRIENGIEIETDGTLISQTLTYKPFKPPFFIGMKQFYINSAVRPTKNVDLSHAPIIEAIVDNFTDEKKSSGLGIVATWDSRNNYFSPHQGHYMETQMVFNDDAFGSDYEYDSYTAYGHHYGYWNPHDIGVRWNYATIETDERYLPPYAIPMVEMRGGPSGYYQGEHVGVIETEYRYHFNHRWMGLGFIGVGRAADHFNELDDQSGAVGKGLGFRYLIARQLGFQMGVDFADGPDGFAWYIQAGSAWGQKE